MSPSSRRAPRRWGTTSATRPRAALDGALQRPDPPGLRLFPNNFVGVCQLPQSPGVPPANCVAELERCVNELGFIGLQPQSRSVGRHWTAPPLTDRYWYPLYETMVELDVPAMVHVSASCNPNFHATGAHYLNADTTAFMQFLTADLFKDFPALRMIIPHGGGAVPYHWGRYRGLAQDMKRPPLPDLMRNNVFFDTCVYHQAGHRSAAEGGAARQHPVRLGDGRRGARHRSRDRALLRRHQALRRRRGDWRATARLRRRCSEGNARNGCFRAARDRLNGSAQRSDETDHRPEHQARRRRRHEGARRAWAWPPCTKRRGAPA